MTTLTASTGTSNCGSLPLSQAIVSLDTSCLSWIILILPVLYVLFFVAIFYLPDQHVLLEWLRRQHIQELVQAARSYKTIDEPDTSSSSDECVL